MVALLASASLYLAAVSGLVVLGEGRDGCPGAAPVTTRLASLLADEPSAAAPDALVIDGQTGALRVRLLSADGAVREQKTLDLQGSCDELADAVATVAVAWRSNLQGDEVPPPVLAARVEQVYDEPQAAPALPPALPPADLELRLGVQSISGARSWAPALVLGAQAPIRHGFGVAFTFTVPVPTVSQDFTGKAWRWMELSAAIAPVYRVVTENLFFDTQVGLAAGVNVTTSESLSAADSYHLAPPSLVTGVRWTFRRSSFMPWLGAMFSVRVVRLDDSPIHNADLPPEPWRFALGLGGTLAFDHIR